MRSLSLMDSSTKGAAFLALQKHAQNNGSKHLYPMHSSRFVFHIFGSAKRVPAAEHACKPANSGEGDRMIVMHAHLS